MEQSVTKRIAKNFSWLLAGNIASGLINFFAIVYVARVLGAAAFGLVQLAQAFLLYLVLVVDSGLSIYGTREIAQDRSRAQQISINIFILRLLIALVIFGLSLAVLLLLPLAPTVRLVFVLTFLLVFYRALNADWVFQGLEKMEYVAVSKLLFSALTLGLILIFVHQPADLVNVPLIQFITGLLIAVVILCLLFKRFFSFDPRQVSLGGWPRAFWLAIPLGLSTIFMQVYDNIDTIMLGLIDSPAVVGIYQAAYRLFYIFAGVYSLWLSTALPVACNKMGADRSGARIFLEKFFKLTLLFVVPLVVLVCLASPLLVRLFFGNDYAASAPALAFLIWALLPLVLSNSYGSLVLIASGYFNEFLACVGAGALANLILNLMLIPKFSYIGAAVATIIAQIAAAVVAFYLAQRILRLGFLSYLFRSSLIALGAFLAYYLTFVSLANWQMTMRLLTASLVFIGVSSGLLLFFERDFIARFAKEILKK